MLNVTYKTRYSATTTSMVTELITLEEEKEEEIAVVEVSAL